MLRFTKHAYSNQTQLLYISLKDEDVSHIQLDILSGTDNEVSPSDYEIAHFLEHLNAQLTSSSRKDSLGIARELESVGVRWNAFTSAHRTGYFMIGPSEKMPLMVDVLLSTFYDFEIDETLFFQEQQAVVQELKRRENSAWFPLRETHAKTLFPNHPRSKTLKERIRNVKRLTPADLLKFRREYYLPRNTFITIAHPEKNKNSILEQVGSFIRPIAEVRLSPSFPRLKWTPRKFTITHVPTFGVKSTRIFISYKTPYTVFDFEQNVALRAIAFLLTDGFSSLLYDKLRRELGLIYSVGAYPLLDPLDRNMSHLQIDTTTSHGNTMDVILTTMNTISEFARYGITAEDHEKYIKNVEVAYDERALFLHPAKWVSNLTNYFIWNKPIMDEDMEKNIAMGVTREAIQQVAKEIFIQSPQIIITYSGPIKSHS